MEVNGTEVGLGIGAFFTTVLAWFKLKPKQEDTDMTSLLKRVSRLEGGQKRLEDSLKHLADTTAIHVRNTRDDVKELKQSMEKITEVAIQIQRSTSRMEGIYEAISGRSSRKEKTKQSHFNFEEPD